MNFDHVEKLLSSKHYKKARRVKAQWMYEYVFLSPSVVPSDVDANIVLIAKLKSGYLLPYTPTEEDRRADDWEAVC